MADDYRIPILLAEYNTLRAEVMLARTEVYRTAGFGLPAAAALVSLGLSASSWWGTGFSILGLVFLVAYVFVNTFYDDKNTGTFTARIREIEDDINGLAGGEKLLIWETYYGWGSIFRPTNPTFGKRPQKVPYRPLEELIDPQMPTET